LDKVLKIVKEIAEKSAGGDYIYYIYRGEPRLYPKVSSTLYRELNTLSKRFGIEALQNIEAVEYGMLEEVRRYTQGVNDNDIEILTQLQHYGGKTNLIDFTTDSAIALFFACNGHFQEDGRVILVNIDTPQGEIVKPGNPVNRVISQKSIFVRPPKGFVEPDEEIIIPKADKRHILDYLRRYHGIWPRTIYNDLHGFIRYTDKDGSAYAGFYKGVTSPAHNRQEYQTAIRYYSEAIRLNPEFDAAYNNWGTALAALGQHQEAIADYNEAIRLDLEYATAYYNRGAAKTALGQYQEAIADYNKAIGLSPRYAEAYNNRGLARVKLRHYEEAIADYDKAIGLNPEYAKAYSDRGNAKANLGHYEQALVDYDKAIDLNPKLALAYYNRGMAQLCLGEMEEGKKYLIRAKDKGLNIADLFRRRYGDCKHFEQKFAVILPDDIKALLKPLEEP